MIIFGRVKEIMPNFIKALIYGKSDVRTAPQSLPFGIDSKPIKDSVAVYCQTENNSNAVIIGYIKKSDLTEIGELRMYCTDDDGLEKFYFHLKKSENGHAELGGNDDNLVRHSELKSAFNELQSKFNALNSAVKAHTHPTAPTGPVSTPTFTVPAPSDSNGNIELSKIFKLKTYKEEEN